MEIFEEDCNCIYLVLIYECWCYCMVNCEEVLLWMVGFFCVVMVECMGDLLWEW